MKGQQTILDFDVFDLSSAFTTLGVEDWEAAARRIRYQREEAEREAERERARRETAERERKAREERARSEREARTRRNAYGSPWSVLGVNPGASKAEIRSAWVKLCRQHHPDAGGKLADQQRVNAAYQSLKGQMR